MLAAVADRLKTAESVTDLRFCHDELVRELRRCLVLEHIGQLAEEVADVHEAVLRRVFFLAEQETVKRSVGIRPPVWCWYVMGSIGRREPTVWTDQDHGILFTCAREEEPACYEFIRHAAAIGTKMLHEVGYPYCSGYVMATNRRWAQSTSDWERQLSSYLDGGWPNDLRFLYIAMDMRPLYGDAELAEAGRRTLFAEIADRPPLLARMGEHVQFPPVPLGWFGNVQAARWGPHSGAIHMKQSGYVQITNALKWLACLARVPVVTTLERQRALKEAGILPAALSTDVQEALSVYYSIRLKYSTEAEDGRDYVLWQTLNRTEQKQLKQAMRTAKRLQRFVARRVVGMHE
ncbi:nucleotidyltransferase [Geobacillus sp. 46C-IIa]|uniref:putative nucleotidyltransferase substrate binding domain-containing protein n=1 Tax=Geobacillus sp. 46C-IIa TaxID=1963025 RepID=UPI0009BED691|nr:putative nucleotidyltransferase substrate binding domain-containing protein [Geobacillus sp. 46C-IIa]OQP05223.1 nucleotidyltransferase [Geobacillus sp. 46C-IIa]QNU26632.1 nucleotidyltransferase [Geobacillus sp. 46C-IIa]